MLDLPPLTQLHWQAFVTSTVDSVGRHRILQHNDPCLLFSLY
jgi:hypothetical protein